MTSRRTVWIRKCRLDRSLLWASIPLCLVVIPPAVAAQDWATDPEFEIGRSPSAGATLWFVRQVRVSHDGSRVYVNEGEAYRSEVNRGRRVTVWSPGGSLLVEVGADGAARDFGLPLGIRLARDGFWVRYPSLLALFSDGGLLLETAGIRESALGRVNTLAVLDDRSGIGLTPVPRLDIRMGWAGGDPDVDDHLLHMSRAGDGWSWDTIAHLDARNEMMGVQAFGGSSPIPTQHFAAQPFPDSDLLYLDVISGTVGVVTRNGDPGEVGLHEIGIRGDTTWRRHVELPPVPIPAEVLGEAVEDVVEGITASPAPGAVLAGLPLNTLRRMVRDALHLPSQRPPVTRAVATASRELWLRSAELTDTLVVWYSVKRGDTNRPPRRVLLPVWYRLSDATDTHVWGIRHYEDGAAQVLGRRLIPPAR